MEQNNANKLHVVRKSPAKYGRENIPPPTPEELKKVMEILQPVLRRNRRKRHARQALRSAGVLCSIGFFFWSANIFESHPATVQPSIEFLTNLSESPVVMEQPTIHTTLHGNVEPDQPKTVERRKSTVAPNVGNSLVIAVPYAAGTMSEPPVTTSVAVDNTEPVLNEAVTTSPLRVNGMEAGAASTGTQWYAGGQEANSIYTPESDVYIQHTTGAPEMLPEYNN